MGNMPDLGKNKPGSINFRGNSASSSSIAMPKTNFTSIAKQLETLGSKLSSGNGTTEDKKQFNFLRRKYFKQNYVPKKGQNAGEDFSRSGTAGGIFKSHQRANNPEGTNLDQYAYDFNWTSLQKAIEENNSVSGRLTKKQKFDSRFKPPTKGQFKEGGLVGQGHNDMRKGGLFK